ncbi:MAG: hypothetical protein HOP11_08460 [Saprospiraceae bacterium]|nr:hypothetical protein [Saprospiraceae bacterium]
MKNWILKGMALYAIVLIGFTSCQKDDSSSTEVENFVNNSVYQLQGDCGLGKLGCFELVFPVTISFPDGTSGTYASYEELGSALREWRKAHTKADGRPEFVFPIDVLKKDGTTVTVTSKEELISLRKECPGRPGRGPGGHIGRGLACFELVYPVTLILPDNSEVTIAKKEDFRAAIKAWREANPGKPTSRPHLKFPLTVTLKEDGTTVTVNSKEELIALKDRCN